MLAPHGSVLGIIPHIGQKNPRKISLQLINYNGRFCCTSASINILAQSNVKRFISRDKIWLAKSIFQAVICTLRVAFSLAFPEAKIYKWVENSTYSQILFFPPTSYVFKSPLETNLSCSNPGLILCFLHSSSQLRKRNNMSWVLYVRHPNLWHSSLLSERWFSLFTQLFLNT